MEKPPKVCPNCSGYGLLFKTMHQELEQEPAAAEESLPPYYPERQVATVSPDTLHLWRRKCDLEIARLEGEKKKLEVGIRQIDQELAHRASARNAAGA